MKRIYIASAVVIVVAAFIVPKCLSNGVNKYSGEEKIMAEYAVETSDMMVEKLRKLVMYSVGVEKIVVDTSSNKGCNYAIAKYDSFVHTDKRYKAYVKVRTIFGLPIARVEVRCDGSIWQINNLFQPPK